MKTTITLNVIEHPFTCSPYALLYAVVRCKGNRSPQAIFLTRDEAISYIDDSPNFMVITVPFIL